MPVQLLSADYGSAVVGNQWIIAAMVVDADGELVDQVPTVTVHRPSGVTATPTVATLSEGVYRAEYVLADVGQHTAIVASADYGSAPAGVLAAAPAYASTMPTVDDVDDYLTSGSGEHSWTTDDLAGALAAETSAQARVCRTGPVYPADLREALLRRVQRNLAMRPNALAMIRGDAEGGDTTMLPGNDPEVRRLEKPYRKLPIG